MVERSQQQLVTGGVLMHRQVRHFNRDMAPSELPRRLRYLCLAAITVLLVACGEVSPSPPPANYATSVTLNIDQADVHLRGLGVCDAAATIFVFSLTMANGDNLGFSVPMDVGRHAIDGGYTVIWLRPDRRVVQPNSGSITVNHWNSRDRADGDLSASGSSFSVSGHWGCRFPPLGD